uniref:Uncharacterized protein n=1 Tax=Bombyx mori TaxID=7091 RepID=A0A8R2GE75_BOMMO|nr:uncharacterized protein LOC105842508 [Bombyx mori]
MRYIECGILSYLVRRKRVAVCRAERWRSGRLIRRAINCSTSPGRGRRFGSIRSRSRGTWGANELRATGGASATAALARLSFSTCTVDAGIRAHQRPYFGRKEHPIDIVGLALRLYSTLLIICTTTYEAEGDGSARAARPTIPSRYSRDLIYEYIDWSRTPAQHSRLVDVLAVI